MVISKMTADRYWVAADSRESKIGSQKYNRPTSSPMTKKYPRPVVPAGVVRTPSTQKPKMCSQTHSHDPHMKPEEHIFIIFIVISVFSAFISVFSYVVTKFWLVLLGN
jgi:hypothetical protein